MGQIPALRIVNPLSARALPWISRRHPDARGSACARRDSELGLGPGNQSFCWSGYFVYYGPAAGYYTRE